MTAILLVLVLAAGAGADPRADLLAAVTALRAAGQLDSAAAQLRDWTRAHPDDGDARFVFGQVLADRGETAQALRVWRAVLADLPVDVDRYRAVTVRLQELGRAQEALDLLEAGRRRIDGGDPFAWIRAELLLELGRYDEAVAAHLTFLRQEPHRRPLVENRIAALAQGEGVAAGADRRSRRYGEALERALGAAPAADRTVLTLLLATCALEGGDPRRGLELLGAGAEDEAVRSALFEYASRCEARHDADVAAAAYGLFAARSGDSPYRVHALLKQAEMREALGDVDGAVAMYRALAQSEPDRGEAAEALLRVARLQAEVLGQPAAALATLAGLDGDAGGDLRRRLLALRADCHMRLDDLDAAAAQLRRLAADPDGALEAAYGLAQLAFYRGDFAAVAPLVDSLVAAAPSHPRANDALDLLLLVDEYGQQPEALGGLARARLHARQGRLAEAEGDWEGVAAGGPAGLRVVAQLERARQLEAADPARALALYEAVLAAAEGEARHRVTAGVGRARLLEARGGRDEALRAYEEALLSAPLDPRAPAIRRQVERLRAGSGAGRAG